jgi:hypothetical protein
MDAVDKLLADLKAEAEKPEPAQTNSTPIRSDRGATDTGATVRSLDTLLQDLDQDTRRSVQTKLLHHSTKPATRPVPLSSPVESGSNPLLAEMKSRYEERDWAAAMKQQQELQAAEQRRQKQAQEKQRRLEELRLKRRAELSEQAQAWLKQFDPRSTEGRWFEEFACGYESRLEAAIDYLEALHSVDGQPA